MTEGSSRPQNGRAELKEVPHGLRARLLELGESRDWEAARKEWKILNVRREEGGAVCPCGRAVHWVHEVRNARTGAAAFLGGACARQALFNGEIDALNRLHQLYGVHERPDGEISDRPATARIRRAYAKLAADALKAS